ncbi:hypothetical protein AGMMS49545_02400 [Betaproteobacteria bacterium]|nr:hypothetical protein AGMMS49545_02400 [Betaproteobacteria bacterium]GHU40204.1 hypothetical protein AGMMS50289_01370 [Betaproteobacteria bacterium]
MRPLNYLPLSPRGRGRSARGGRGGWFGKFWRSFVLNRRSPLSHEGGGELSARLLLLVFTLFLCTAAHALPWQGVALHFSIGRIEHPLFSVRDIKLDTDGKGGSLTLEKLDVMGQVWAKINISCGELRPDAGHFACRQGRLNLDKQQAIPLQLEQEGDNWHLLLQPAGERWDLLYEKNGRISLTIMDGKPDLLLRLVPALASFQSWKPAGKLNGSLRYESKGAFSGQLTLAKGLYNAPDGLQAAENLEATLNISGNKAGENWKLQGNLEWQKGAVYSDPVLLNASAQRLEFAGELGEKGWKAEQASFSLPRAGSLVFKGDGDWQGIRNGALSTASLDLKHLGEDLITPLLAGRELPKIDLTGRIGATVNWQAGELASVDIHPEQAGLVLDHGRVALEGIDGHLAWRQQQGNAQDEQAGQTGELRVGRLALGRLETGAFKAPVTIWPRSFVLTEPIVIPVLDGEFNITYLTAGFDSTNKEWEGALGFSLTPIALNKLTEVLDLPKMNGTLSADLPLIRYERRVAALEGGALVIQVFDGYLSCTDFRFIDPLGMRPRVKADVNARHIDLEQMTQTFSFGQITGFIDADLQGLELGAGWRPQAFQARINSSPGSYRRRISQKAVDNITSLGGGGAIAAIQKSALRFFQDFGYRDIGISCTLENGVCNMAGIAGQDKGTQYTIIEGGGIPALTVMGYNRRVNWEELVERIKAATESSAPVIQ